MIGLGESKEETAVLKLSAQLSKKKNNFRIFYIRFRFVCGHQDLSNDKCQTPCAFSVASNSGTQSDGYWLSLKFLQDGQL